MTSLLYWWRHHKLYRFINARRRILQPMLDASNPDANSGIASNNAIIKSKKSKPQRNRSTTDRFWQHSVTSSTPDENLTTGKWWRHHCTWRQHLIYSIVDSNYSCYDNCGTCYHGYINFWSSYASRTNSSNDDKSMTS